MSVRRGLLLPAVLLAAACEPTTVGVRGNGAFSPDGGRVLQVEARYDSFSREEPWTDAPSATNWRALFLEGPADLAAVQSVAVFDGTPRAVKALMRAPLYWLDGVQVALAVVDGRAVGYRLRSTGTFEYALPEDRRGEYFLFAGRDLRSEVKAVVAVPSPDGTRVAVLFSAAYGEKFVHVVSFFSADGLHERTVPLAEFQDTDESLLLDVPAPAPAPADGAQPVPAWGRAALLWAKDGSGVFVVDRDEALAEDGGVPTVTGQGMKVDVASGPARAVEAVPAFPLPTSGGPVSPDGKLLVTWSPSSAPNDSELRLQPLEDWVDFGELGTVSPADAGWAR